MYREYLNGKTVLVTGAAGFIGANLVRALLGTGAAVNVIGLDNVNDYYDVSIKEYRLKELEKLAQAAPRASWQLVRGDLADRPLVDGLFERYRPQLVVNLAAQAGVRYSITDPDAYIKANLIGFYHILEACRHSYDGGAPGVAHLVYASSSSVYGSNQRIPYAVEDKADCPMSLYAATKKSNELMAHAYASLYGIPSTGLRFFTVYGPAGRPIWPISALPTSCGAVRPSKFSIMAAAAAISPISTISWRAFFASWPARRPAKRRTTAVCCRPTPSTTSATATPKICWISFRSCRRS